MSLVLYSLKLGQVLRSNKYPSENIRPNLYFKAETQYDLVAEYFNTSIYNLFYFTGQDMTPFNADVFIKNPVLNYNFN